MKIALVSPYDFASPGGVVAHISQLYDQFIGMGHYVKIIAPCSHREAFVEHKDLIALGRPYPVPSAGSIARVTLSPLLSYPLKAILEREKFDIVHLHEPLGSTLPFLALGVSHTINVGTFHACHRVPRGYQIARPFAMRWFRRLDGKIAVSRPAMEFIGKHFPGEYEIIPNGINLEHFSADVPPIEEFCNGKLNILFVGRLEKRKGLKYLLFAYEQVKKELPNTRLIVVGPGERREYENIVQKLNLEDVAFVGYASHEDLPRYYKTADVFCAPATGEESFGIVLLEAMAASKPIVASANEGYASVMSQRVEGLLVPPEDGQAIASALISLLGDESLRQEMGARGRLNAEIYSWQNIAQRVMDYYGSLLAKHAA
jgi:phosphatidylinositol alpha-mannosyltransferase